jgi:cell division protein FtsA
MALFNQSKSQEETKKPNIVVGLDIGTSKVCAVVASPSEEGRGINILGIGLAESDGLKRGVVANIDKTIKSIEQVIEQAQMTSGHQITDVVVGIAGDHIDSLQSKGVIGISNTDREITQSDVDRVIDESRNFKLPNDRSILHVIPQEYIIDGQDGILDPIGMAGVRMEVKTHVVTGLQTAIQNIYRCVERIGLNITDVVLEPLASSYAVLDDDEKEVGVALIDIGGGTTDIAIFEDRIIRFTSVFGVAGEQVTNDIRKGLGIVGTQAERIKRDFGHSYLNSIINDDLFMIPGVGGRKPIEISKSYLCQIIQPRLEEIFQFALAEIRRSGYASNLGAGAVITGGSAMIEGIEDLAQDVLGMPVKVGFPSHVTYSGLAPEVQSPMYSTGVGLALFGLESAKKSRQMNNIITNDYQNSPTAKKDGWLGKFGKIKKALEEF